VDKFIQGIVAPHIVNTDAAQQDAYIASVDDAISTQMRSLLHEPAFQALESAWRSVHQLVSSLETGVELKLYLLDVSKDELSDDVLAAGENLESSGLYRLLVEQGIKTQGGEPWSLLVGDYSFGPDKDDVNLLGALGAIAAQAGGPFLAGGSSALLGVTSLAETPSPEHWNNLTGRQLLTGALERFRRRARAELAGIKGKRYSALDRTGVTPGIITFALWR